MTAPFIQPLRATLRLQFHKGFTLDQAVPLVPYFARLGISHVYASPLLAARAGSMHGYDVVDPTTVNPELGGEAALRRLVKALREQQMGLILDIVSNHMAVGGADNPWWLDLLEWGRLSPFGEFFDIQWHSPDPLMEGQLLLPFLGSDYGIALQDGTLPLRFDAQGGSFYVQHYDHRFPICPMHYGELLPTDGEQLKSLAERFTTLSYQTHAHSLAVPLKAELRDLASDPVQRQSIEQHLGSYDSLTPDGFQRLHNLLERQSYRLASWRTAADDINCGVFSMSTNWAACASSGPPCSKPPTQKYSSWWRKGWWTVYASTTSTASPIPVATVANCDAGSITCHRAGTCLSTSRRSSAKAKLCTATGRWTALPVTSS